MATPCTRNQSPTTLKHATTALLLVAGIINMIPVVGVVSVEQLVRLYEVPLDNTDLVILMRHRAVLFGLLGVFIIYSIIRPALQQVACIAGLISMLSFVVIAYAVGDFGQPMSKIIVADIIGSVALVAVLLMRKPTDRALS